jgi:hypothetical protein
MMEENEPRHAQETLRMQAQIDSLSTMMADRGLADRGLADRGSLSSHPPASPSSGFPGGPGSPRAVHGAGQPFLGRGSSSHMPLHMPMFRTLSNSSHGPSHGPSQGVPQGVHHHGGGGAGGGAQPRGSHSPTDGSGVSGSSAGSVPGLSPALAHHFSGHSAARHRASTLENDVPAHLRLAKDDIQLLGLIGRGSFGEVWRALHSGSVVAVKVFLSEEEDVSSEVKMMAKASGHKNIIPLIGVVIQDDPYNDPQVAIVTKYMSNGSLHDMLVNEQSANYHGKSLGLLELVSMANAAAEGVESLHGRGIIHRDLACRNLLVDEGMGVCVCDFGFARLRPVGKGFTATNLGPVRWEAPESLKHKE